MKGLDTICGSISSLEHELLNLSKKLEQEKTNMFNQIVEFSPNFTAIIQDEKFVFINLMGRSLLKCHFTKDIIGKKLFQFVTEKAKPEIINSLCNPTSDKKSELVHLNMYATDGSQLWIEANSSPFLFNNKPAALMVGRDITQELLSRARLREAEDRYREIFDNSVESLFLFEVSEGFVFRIIDINPKFVRDLGIEKQNYVGKEIGTVLSVETLVKLNTILHRCVETREKFENEIELHLPTGVKSYQIKLVPILDDLGKVNKISGAAQDISEQINNKKQLEILGFVLSNAPYAVFITEGNHMESFSYVNDEACRSLGYTREELLKCSVYDINPVVTSDILVKIRDNASENGTEVFETWHKTKQGFVFPVEIKLSYHKLNGVFYGVSQVRDLTSEKLKQQKLDEANEKLIESERRYREIFNHSNDNIHLVEVLENSKFRFLEVNSQYEKSIGIRSEEFIGKTVDENTTKELALFVNAKYQECLDKDRIVHEIVELDLSVGKRSYDSHLIPIRDRAGKIYRILGVGRDITEELAIKQELEKSHNLLANAEIVALMGNYYFDVRSNQFTCSKGANMIFGFPVDTIINEKVDVLKFTHPDDLERITAKWQYALVNRVKFDETYRIVDTTGKVKVIHNIGSFGSESIDSQDIFLGSIKDVSDLHSLKKEVITQEERMKILAEDSPLGILIANGETPLYINKALLDLLMIDSIDDFNTVDYYDYIHPDDRRPLRNLQERLLSNTSHLQESYQLTVRHVLPSGNIKVFDLRIFVCMMEDSKYFQVTVIDITDEIEKEKLLSKLASDSLHTNQKNEIIAEIRNELHTILEKRNYKTTDFRNIFNLLKYYSDCKTDWGLFTEHFENLHPCFITNLKLLCPNLTLNDLKHCACIRLNFDTKEIARFFNVTPASIQTARVRLKKKLNLPENIDLRELISNI